MEVILHDCHGIPEGSILSVRAGSNRRQAPLEIGKALRFPVDAGGDLQVDILAVLGRSKIHLDPSSKRYLVQLDSGSSRSMNCDLEVRHNEEKAEGATDLPLVKVPARKTQAAGKALDAVKERSHSKHQQAAMSAQRYMEKHQLVPAVQAAMQETVSRRPEDPLTAMAEFLLAIAAKQKPAAALTGDGEEPLKEAPVPERQPNEAPEKRQGSFPEKLRQHVGAAADVREIAGRPQDEVAGGNDAKEVPKPMQDAPQVAVLKMELERIAAEEIAAEAAASKKAEEERLDQERETARKAEADRREAERLAKERAASARAAAAERKPEQEGTEAARLAAETVEAAKKEAARTAQAERLEAERLAAEHKAEQERREAARLAAEKEAADKAEAARREAADREATRKAEAERLEAERLAAERKAEQERVESARLAAEKEARDKADAVRKHADQLEAAKKAEAEKQEAARVAAKAEADRREADLVAAAIRATEKARAEMEAAEKARSERLAKDEEAVRPLAESMAEEAISIAKQEFSVTEFPTREESEAEVGEIAAVSRAEALLAALEMATKPPTEIAAVSEAASVVDTAARGLAAESVQVVKATLASLGTDAEAQHLPAIPTPAASAVEPVSAASTARAMAALAVPPAFGVDEGSSTPICLTPAGSIASLAAAGMAESSMQQLTSELLALAGQPLEQPKQCVAAHDERLGELHRMTTFLKQSTAAHGATGTTATPSPSQTGATRSLHSTRHSWPPAPGTKAAELLEVGPEEAFRLKLQANITDAALSGALPLLLEQAAAV